MITVPFLRRYSDLNKLVKDRRMYFTNSYLLNNGVDQVKRGLVVFQTDRKRKLKRKFLEPLKTLIFAQ